MCKKGCCIIFAISTFTVTAENKIELNNIKNNTSIVGQNYDLNKLITDNLLNKKSNTSFNTFLKYSADKKTKSEVDSNVFFLDGNAYIEVGDTKLEADKIKLTSQKNYNVIEGFAKKNQKGNYEPRVLVTFNKKKIFADKVRYCVDSARGIADNALYLQDKLIMRAKWLKKDFDDTIYAKDVFLTTCNTTKPHYGFFANRSIFKGHKIFIQGANVMFLGVRVPIPFSFIYIIQQERKSGFTYPSGLNWSDQGFYIKDFGYYWYFNDCRDLHITGTLYLGSFTVGISAKHNYIVSDSYSGNINFTYNAMPIYQRRLFYTQIYKNNWTLSWKHKLLNSKVWNFNIDIDLRGEGRDDNMSDEDKNESSSRASMTLSRSKLLNIFSLNINSKYNKNFKTKIEELIFPDISLSTDTASFFKYFSTSLSLQAIANITNKKIEYEVRDEHDIHMKDDDKIDQFASPLFNIDNLFNPVNFINNIIPGLKCSVPLNFNIDLLKGIKLNIHATGNTKLYNSKYNTNSDQIDKSWKQWYLIYDFSLGGSISTTLISDKIKFDEFARVNIFHVKDFFHTFSPTVTFSFSPEANEINKFSECYKAVKGKVIDLFAHTLFGNVNNHKSATLSFSTNGSLDVNINDAGTYKKTNIFGYNFSGGYDFLDHNGNYWKDISCGIRTKIYKLDISCDMSFDLYKHEQIQHEQIQNANNAEKKYSRTQQFFWQGNLNPMQKLWDTQRLKSSIKISLPLITAKKEENKDNNIKNLNIPDDNTIPDYAPFVLYDKLNTSISYRYDYSFNPIRFKKDITHSAVLIFSSQLSKNWTFSGDIVYDIQKNQFKSFKIEFSRPLHCWTFSGNMQIGRNDKNNITISYNISLKPRDTVLNALGQNRGDNYAL